MNNLVAAPEDYRYNIYTPDKHLVVSLPRVEGEVLSVVTEGSRSNITSTLTFRTEDYGTIQFKANHAQAVNVGMRLALYFLEGKPVTEYNYERSE